MFLRLARTADEAGIRDCAALAYGRYIADIGRPPAPMSADFSAQITRGWVRVAVDDSGHLSGYIVFYPTGETMFLESVAVTPDASGQGVGKTLIALCEDCARATGLRAVRLYTNARMTENLALYPRLGYVEIDRREEDGFDRVWFEK